MAYGGTSAGTSGSYSQSGVVAISESRNCGYGYKGFRMGGGSSSPTFQDTIDYWSTISLGNAVDWGGEISTGINGYNNCSSDGNRGFLHWGARRGGRCPRRSDLC